MISPNFLVWKFCEKTQLSHRNYGILRSVKYYFPNKRSMFNDPKVFMPVNFVTTLKVALILISQWLLINLQESGSVAELCFKKIVSEDTYTQ